jgi:hypothetical protein
MTRHKEWRSQTDSSPNNMPTGVTPGVATIVVKRRGLVVYVQLEKAMYGIPSAALLFQEGNTDQPPNANVTSKGVAMAHLGSMDNIADGNSSYINEFSSLNDGTIAKCFDGELHAQHKAATGHAIQKDWVQLDNHFALNIFFSRHLFRNIREAQGTCRISCNAGVVEVQTIGDLPRYQFQYGIIQTDPQTSCHCAA